MQRRGALGATQVLINAGQANAATGDAGYQDCLESADAVASALGISADEVLLFLAPDVVVLCLQIVCVDNFFTGSKENVELSR